MLIKTSVVFPKIVKVLMPTGRGSQRDTTAVLETVRRYYLGDPPTDDYYVTPGYVMVGYTL